jgi:hypothetical protein
MTIEFTYEEYAALNHIIVCLLDDTWEGTEADKRMLLRIGNSLHKGNPEHKRLIDLMEKGRDRP